MIRLSGDLGFIRSCKKSKRLREKPKRKLKSIEANNQKASIFGGKIK